MSAKYPFRGKSGRMVRDRSRGDTSSACCHSLTCRAARRAEQLRTWPAMDSGAHITCRASCRTAGRTLQASSARLRDATVGGATAVCDARSGRPQRPKRALHASRLLLALLARSARGRGGRRLALLLVGLAVIPPALIAALGTLLVLVRDKASHTARTRCQMVPVPQCRTVAPDNPQGQCAAC